MEVDYEEYVKDNRSRFTIEALARCDLRRSPSRKRKDVDEERLLTHLDGLRWQRYAYEGRVVYLGERTYRFRIND